MCVRRSDFFQDAFTKCVHIRNFLDIYKLQSFTVDTKTKDLCIVICPKKFMLAYNVFEVTELCRTPADISKPNSSITKISTKSSK